MKNTPAVSTARIRNPAAAGPAMPVRFMAEVFRLIAFIRFFSGTISDSMACLLGMLKAISEPLTSPMTKMCQNSTLPVMSSTPRMTVKTALPAWEMMIRCLRARLSASAPPTSDTMVIGREKLIITMANASGESSSSRRISHPLVNICMFIPTKETNDPASIHRKSRYIREASIGNREEAGGDGVSSAGAVGEGSGVGSVRWSNVRLSGNAGERRCAA